MLKVPVVTLITYGHHINSPFWNLHNRKIHTEGDYTLLFTPPDQVKQLPVDEINRRIVEAGTYDSGTMKVHIDSLPNAKKFIRLGNGTMRHDMNGFHVSGTDVDGDPFEMELQVPSLYSVHIEYEYLGKYGDCVDLNTLMDTWYTYPEPDQEFSVTKMALATEELYFAYRRSIGKPCPPGLA